MRDVGLMDQDVYQSSSVQNLIRVKEVSVAASLSDKSTGSVYCQGYGKTNQKLGILFILIMNEITSVSAPNFFPAKRFLNALLLLTQ